VTVVATAGHVDHGKSSLVKALTGTDPDRFAEEQRRGLTIDLGFAHTTLPSGAELSFVDVPGHIRFLRNMLAGVGAVRACLFVVAATEGWKPQSEEHLRILEVLGVRAGVIALTKVDLADDDLAEYAALEVGERVAGTFLADAPVVPVSSVTGAGIDALADALDDLVARESDGPADAPSHTPSRTRLWIDRSFAAKGSGTVVTGTLTGGALHVEQMVRIEPLGRTVRVRGLQRAGRSASSIAPDNRVAVNLAGVDHGEVGRGEALVEPDRWWTTACVDGSLHVLDSLGHPVSRRGAYLAYIGSGEHPVRLRVLGTERIAPGGAGLVRLFLPVALPLLPGDRFVLRESGRDETVGGGEVLDVDPVLPASRARPDRSVERVVRERGWVRTDDLERLTGRSIAPSVGVWATTSESLSALGDELVARIDAAGGTGLDVAALDDRERAVLVARSDVVIDAGVARRPGDADPEEPSILGALRDGGFTPPPVADSDRGRLREFVRRGTVVVRDGMYFHADAIADAGEVAERLLAATPAGFTVADFRDATGASRKFVLPLVAELDARGITRRRGDLRIAGPRLYRRAVPAVQD
jgi:selenocysteine-specific elongation factor